MLPVQPIHPFPARMAPELALREIQQLPKRATVLDPMMGSGTVLRVAVDCGLRAIGRDVDPLAVLITRVWTTPIDTKLFRERAVHVLNTARNMGTKHISLPWIDGDPETSAYIDFWFGKQQKVDLRKLSSLIIEIPGPEGEALRIALSRIIVTKKVGASLAHDVSHSRPHRVLQDNSFAVLDGFWYSVSQVAKRLETYPIQEQADVCLEDTRNLTSIANHSVDAVITSPPYLNAIDYLRGHRLALVWLGYRVSEIRPIRSGSIGAERAPEGQADTHIAEEIIDQMSLRELLPRREQRLITRYILDLFAMLLEIHRVLCPGGRAVFVIGNSCLHGIFIRNALAVMLLAERIGFACIREEERELPPNRRYLPPPSVLEQTDLKKRMRTETVLTFVRV
jgi:tRNA G10  N-methylase Trm11